MRLSRVAQKNLVGTQPKHRLYGKVIMSTFSIPTWLKDRVIDEDYHEELRGLFSGTIRFCFRDITKEAIIKYYNNYPRESFYRLLRILGFYGVKLTGKIAAYSGPQEKYPEVMYIEKTHWEEKIILPEVNSSLVSALRSFGLSKIKQLHGVPVQGVIGLFDNTLSSETITTSFHAKIIKVHDDFFQPTITCCSCEIINSIGSDELYCLPQTSPSDLHTIAENTANEYFDERLSQPIESLQLSSKYLDSFRANNINYLGELIARNDEEIAEILHHSKKSLQELKVRLWLVDLCTGLKVKSLNLNSEPSVEEEDALISIEAIHLSVRSANCLKLADIRTIPELLSKTDNELLAIPHFGRKCLREIQGKLAGLHPLKQKKKSFPKFNLMETSQLNIDSVQDEIFPKLKTKISELVISVRTRGCLKERKIEYIWQLVQLSKDELLEIRNFGRKSISELDEILENFGFWFGMQITPKKLADIYTFEPYLKPLILNESCKQLAEKFSHAPFCFLNQRENLVVEERLFKVGKKKTLEELAMQFLLTRERVRQLEKSATSKIKQQYLKELWTIVDNLKQKVDRTAGLADMGALRIDPKEFSLKEQTIISCLFQMIDEKLFIDWKFNLISTRGDEFIFLICDAIELNLFEVTCDKFFTENDLCEAVEKACVDFGLSSDLNRQNLTMKFQLVKKVKIRDNLLCYGRITKQDQIILAFKELFPDGLEVYKNQELLMQKLKIYDPECFGSTSPRAILGRLTEHPDVFLWRRGFFIHKEHLHYEEIVVKKVIVWIEQRFDQGHSRFQVDVPFNIFKDDLLQSGIPNQYALYTLLRLQHNNRIGQRKFPTIVDLQADIDIQEGILEELENYFLQAGGAIPFSVLKDEFIVKRGWKIYSVQNNITVHSEVIYPWQDSSYIHLKYIEVNYSKLEELLDAIRAKLDTIQGAYSLKGARKEMSVLWEQACPSASVRTMVKLIRTVDPEDLQIDRYFILYSDQLTESVSAPHELEEFCLDKDMEVNSHELHDEFCKQRGWSENQYYTAIRKANLFRSGKATYLHPATINWSDSLSRAVHQVMESYLDERNKNHYPQMQIDELIYQYALPDLPQNIQWTPYLLKSVGAEFGDFLFFDDAYIAIDNDFDIEDLDDMIGFLIGRHFRMGITKRDEVEQMLWREGILESGRSIPSDQYFNESSIVFLSESDEVGLSSTGIERYAQSV